MFVCQYVPVFVFNFFSTDWPQSGAAPAAVNFEYPPPITPPLPPTPLTLVKEIIFYPLRKVKLVDEDDPLQGLACRTLMAQHVRLSRPATSTCLIILRHD